MGMLGTMLLVFGGVPSARRSHTMIPGVPANQSALASALPSPKLCSKGEATTSSSMKFSELQVLLFLFASCGVYSGRQHLTGLSRVCLGSSSRAGGNALKALFAGKHPDIFLAAKVGPGMQVSLLPGEEA